MGSDSIQPLLWNTTQLSSTQQTFDFRLYYCNHFLIYQYLHHDFIKNSHTCRRFLFYTKVLFFFTSESIYLKYPKFLQFRRKLSLAPQTICEHMFSDLNSDHTFHVFWLHVWFIYFPSFVAIVHLFWVWNDIVYPIKVDSQLNQINSSQNIIFQPIHNQIWNTNWKGIKDI